MLGPLSLYTTPYHPDNPTNHQGKPSVQGAVLIALLLNSCLFGLVSQQFCGYWVCRFKDSLRLKLFIIVQYSIIVLQGIMMWHAAHYRFVTLLFVPPSYRAPSISWDTNINAMCQLILILQVNVFLALRIYSLTKSFFQSGLIITLSVIAFVIGMITTLAAWKVVFTLSARKVMTVVWHGIQALAECLITFLLVRVLLKSRIGIRKSDNVVNFLVRGAIQTGFLAALWAIGGLVASFFVPQNLIYRVFDVTSGSVCTHAIFDTLISRVQLRGHMSATTFDLGWTIQEIERSSRDSPRHDGSTPAVRTRRLVPQSRNTSDPALGLTNMGDVIEMLPIGKSATAHEFSNYCDQAQ